MPIGQMKKLRHREVKCVPRVTAGERITWSPSPFYLTKKKRPRGEGPHFAQEEVETQKFGSFPSYSVNSDQALQTSRVFFHLSTELDLSKVLEPRVSKILVLATISLVQDDATVEPDAT